MRSHFAVIATAVVAAFGGGVTPLQAADNAGGAWRCGPGVYSDQPCPGGAPIATREAPDEAARRAAEDTNTQTRRSADAMERERLQREAQARREGRPIVLGERPATDAAPAEPRRRSRGRKSPANQREVFKARHQAPRKASSR